MRGVTVRIGVALALMAACCRGYPARDGQATAPPSPVIQTPSQKTGDENHPPVLQRRNPRYQIATSDVIVLDFPLTPEFNQTVTVQPDGFVALHGVGDMHVAGLTIPELTEKLREAYSKILHDPVINVDLKDFQKPYFVAFGEVGKPGQYDLRGDITVAQAVAMAGGFVPSAKHSQVLLFRRVNAEWAEVKKLDMKHMLSAGNLSEDLHLQPGDMLFVPKNAVSKVKPFIPWVSLPLTPWTW
jgi:polysaccharide biosynthesis/export protein